MVLEGSNCDTRSQKAAVTSFNLQKESKGLQFNDIKNMKKA
jgi:hypothetical protein